MVYAAALLAAMTAAASAQVPVPRLHMPVGAAEIESHDASPGFIKQIAGCHKRVPAALLARTDNARIVVAKDIATVVTLFSLPADFFSIHRFTYGADKIRGMAIGRATPRTVVFIENTLSTDHPNYVCNVVLHELAHLYDYPPSHSPATSRQSEGEHFITAFKQDIADTLAKREMHKLIDKYKHYRSHEREAFAEAVSITVLLHPKMKPYQNYAALFPNVMSYVRKLLIDDGIIRSDHKGDAQIVREFERRR